MYRNGEISEISQTKKDYYCTISLIHRESTKVDLRGIENWMVATTQAGESS
jgi:hypothetical protein